MRRLYILPLVFILSVPALSEPIHGLGFAAGQLSGVGLSYRVMTEHYGAQVTFGALSIKDESSEINYPNNGQYPIDTTWPMAQSYSETYHLRSTDGNIGLMFMKTLHRSKWATLYALTGFCTFFQIDKYEEQLYELENINNEYYEYRASGEAKKYTEKKNTLYGGLGIGIEIRFSTNIRMAIEWPLTYSSKGDFIMYIPQVGLHYFF